MKLLGKACVVVLALYLEYAAAWLGYSLSPVGWHGPLVDTRYRHKERLAAWSAHIQNPSSENEATYQKELRLMRQHPNPEDVFFPVLFAVLFVVSGGATIYYTFRRPQPPALPA